MLPLLVDTHCHLTHPRFAQDLDLSIERARAAGIGQMITIGTSVADAQACVALVSRYPDVLRCAGGIDPHSAHAAGSALDDQLAQLERLLRAGGFCALGEIGLEYHHKLDSVEAQISCFQKQLEMAVALDLPVVIHSRDAHPDMRMVLAKNPRNRGVIHSFTGTVEDANGFLALGWHLSFNGMLTFKGNDALRAAAQVVPNDRLLVETDSPYLAPVPMRGKRCEPAMVVHTLQLLAEIRGQRLEDLAAWTTRNAEMLFRLPATAAHA